MERSSWNLISVLVGCILMSIELVGIVRKIKYEGNWSLLINSWYAWLIAWLRYGLLMNLLFNQIHWF